MSRAGSEEYQAELGFLEFEEARVLQEIVRRLSEIEFQTPDLIGRAADLAEKPIAEWEPGIRPGLITAIGGLKQEQHVIGELKDSIDSTPLVKTLERQIEAVENSEEETVRMFSGSYSSEYWSEEQARAILNQLFTNWARWLRGEPPQVR